MFAILSVVLSALQVRLATTTLQENGPFQRTSYGFTVISLVTIAAGFTIVFLVWLSLFSYHLLATWLNDRDIRRRRSAVKSTWMVCRIGIAQTK
jgi:hypothetical protein